MPDTLIIFEFADEIDDFLKNQRGIENLKDDTISILAIEPCAQAKLRCLGIPYHNTMPFFGRRGHEATLLASDKIVRAIRKKLIIQDNLGISEGYNNTLLFYFRFFLHHLLFLTEIISRAVDSLKPKTLIAPQENIAYPRNIQIGKDERYLGEIVRLYCYEHGLYFKSFPQSQITAKYKRSSLIRATKLDLVRKIFFILSLLCYRLLNYKKKPILSYSQDYNMARIVQNFQDVYDNTVQVYLQSKDIKGDIKKIFSRKNFWSFISLPRSAPKLERIGFEKNLNYNINRIEEVIKKYPQLFNYKGVDLSQLLLSFIRQAIVPYLMELYGRTFYLKKILTKLPSGLVISQYSRELTYNLGELSRNLGIPGILISHGSHVPVKNNFEAIEWGEHGLGLMNTHYEYLAVQTPWAKEYLERIPTDSKTIITGPLLFANKFFCREVKNVRRKRILPNIKNRVIILHAGTPKTRKTMRFYVYETVDEYIENINALIRAVEALSDIYLVVRFRPSPDLSTEDLQTLLVPSECYDIHSGGSFNDYLQLSDLVMSYSSTAIEEALQNQIPVLQYDPQGKYCHIPGEKLASGFQPTINACYFASSEKDLRWGLKWIIENHLTRRVPPDIWKGHKLSDNEMNDLTTYFRNKLWNIGTRA